MSLCSSAEAFLKLSCERHCQVMVIQILKSILHTMPFHDQRMFSGHVLEEKKYIITLQAADNNWKRLHLKVSQGGARMNFFLLS